jgi:hypothetical protein
MNDRRAEGVQVRVEGEMGGMPPNQRLYKPNSEMATGNSTIIVRHCSEGTTTISKERRKTRLLGRDD